MRTKALFVAAATGLAALTTSFAQVYSVNVVGYVNVTLKDGYNLIANPLATQSNAITDLVPAINFAAYFKFVDGTYKGGNYLGAWTEDEAGLTLDPGEGLFYYLPPGTGDTVVTFVGEVMEGQLSNPLPAGLSMKSSMVPQSGALSALGFPADNFDVVYRYDPALQGGAGGYITDTYIGAWSGDSGGAEPTLDPGQAMFVFKGAANSWDRDFEVPRP